MNRISPFQLTDASQWSGLTTENHLNYMFMQDRQLVSNLIEDILDMNLGKDFDDFVDSWSTMTIDQDTEFEWLLAGPDIKNYPLINYYDDPTAGTQPTRAGIAYTSFYLEFPVRVFEWTDVIVNGNSGSKEVYQLRVKSDPKPKGTNWLYEVELMTNDPAAFMPTAELAAGTRWSKLYSPVSQTLSQRGGNVTHSGYFKMVNRMSTIRKEYEVPGNMINAKDNPHLGAFYFDKKTGQKFKTWLNKLDFDFEEQFKRQKSYLSMFSRWSKNAIDGTHNQKDPSGYEIKMGAGFYQQISPTNIHYLDWDLDSLEQILLGLSIGKLPRDKRKFVLVTGERGWMKFHKLVEARGFAFSANNAGNRITGSGNNLRLGGQFVSYGFLNGIEVELRYLPLLDDPNVNTEQHPDGGLTSSYEVLIMDIGTTNQKPNVERVRLKGEEMDTWRYIPGLRDPFQPYNSTKPTMAASAIDGYKVMKKHIGGVILRNPTRVARILPNFV